jgi:hypothetical protein
MLKNLYLPESRQRPIQSKRGTTKNIKKAEEKNKVEEIKTDLKKDKKTAESKAVEKSELTLKMFLAKRAEKGGK